MLAGFKGQDCEPGSHAHELIVKHKVSALLLKTENYQSGRRLKAFLEDLQALAKGHGYERPLLICLDEEVGSQSMFYDDEMLCKFPCEMALASTRDVELIRQIGQTIAIQWRSVGVNMYVGPVLDICNKHISKFAGIHTFGTTADQVTKYAGAFCQGLKDGGILVCAKHFPGIGNAVMDEQNEVLSIQDCEETIVSNGLVPYRDIIAQGTVDAVTVSNAAFPNVSDLDYLGMLSPKIVEGMLRNRLDFKGVAIGECVEMDMVYSNWGAGQAAALAILHAGCDMVTVCESYEIQREVLHYLEMAFDDESREMIHLACTSRIENLRKSLSWETLSFELSPVDISENKTLADATYGKTISMVRDHDKVVPLTSYMMSKRREYETLEFLNQNLPSYKFAKFAVLSPAVKDLNITGSYNCGNINKGELEVIFKEFVNYLSSYSLMHTYHVYHIEYGATGLTRAQEEVIKECDLIICITVDACTNSYQLGISKKLTMMIEYLRDKINGQSKQLIFLGTGSPYECQSLGPVGSSYICCYDYSFLALRNVCKVLFGDLKPQGRIFGNGPTKNIVSFESSGGNWDFGGLLNTTHDSVDDAVAAEAFQSTLGTEIKSDVESARVRPWVVEEFVFDRDILPVYAMSKSDSIPELQDVVTSHTLHRLRPLYQECEGNLKTFMIRNSTIGLTYGFILTYYEAATKTGQILYMVVNKWRRRQQIGEALHRHVLRYFTIEKRCQDISLGGAFPLVLLFTPSLIAEFKKVWQVLEKRTSTRSNNKIETATSAFYFIEFFRSTGWGSSKYGFVQQERHILKLNIGYDWALPGTNILAGPKAIQFNSPEEYIRTLRGTGVEFELLPDDKYPQILLEEYISRNELEDEEEVRFPDIFRLASRFMARESRDRKFTMILGAFVQGVPVGCLVIYSKMSELSNFYMLIDNVGTFKDNAMGITAVSVAHAEILNELGGLDRDLIKLGLITTAVQIVRALKIKNLVLHNVSNECVPTYEALGFERYRVYCALFGRKKAFEWVL